MFYLHDVSENRVFNKKTV